MRRLIIQVCVLGLVSGLTCGLALTGYEVARYHWWLGYNLDVFGTQFEGSVGVVYSVPNSSLHLFGFSCLVGWFAWSVAAANREGVTTSSAEKSSRLRGSAWIVAVVCGTLVAVGWAALDLAGDIPAVRPFSTSNLVRAVVLIALLALCTERFHRCWKVPDSAVAAGLPNPR
jgi:hypothetical protein